MEATLEAQNAPERQKWLACWVVLLVSWLRRSTSVLWRLRAPRFWTIAITSLSTAARRVGRGCQEAILANCPAHQRIDRDVVDTFLRSLGSLLIIPMSQSNFTMYSFEIFTPDDNKFTVRGGTVQSEGAFPVPQVHSRLSQADCVQDVRGAGRLVPAALICAAPWPMRRREQLAKPLGQFFPH